MKAGRWVRLEHSGPSIPRYSYLNAAAGSVFAARRAGYSVASVQNTKAVTVIQATSGQCSSLGN